MHRPYLLAALLLLTTALYAQLSDDFSDGNFTAGPEWSGNTASWSVNNALQLQSNNTTANSSFYLSTMNTLASSVQWELSIRLGFNTSSANYVDIFLTADQADLTASGITGYFIRLGNTDDEISLYRKDGAAIVKIIDGVDDILNTGNTTVKIKVTRDVAGKWTLFRDLSGSGNNYSSEGTATDLTYMTSSYFGIFIKQSTASFFQKHFFDDIVVKPYEPDRIPPQILSVTATGKNSLDLVFSEALETNSSQEVNNYVVSNTIGQPATATRDLANNTVVHLVFNNNFPNGINCTMTVNGVKDIAENELMNATAEFVFYTAMRYDVLMDELMADPSPAVVLPEYEYIELVNTSSFPLNLQGWTLNDATGNSGPMPSFNLKPDSFVIICSNTALPAFNGIGKVIAVTGFPSLDNDGETIFLKAADGTVIHSVSYTSGWYDNEIKKAGGWSLEMIDTKSPCVVNSNWKASVDPRGGTPGKKNSIDGIIADTDPPTLKNAFVTGGQSIHLVFSEPVDSMIAANTANYTADKDIRIIQAFPVPPNFNEVEIYFDQTLITGTVYTITARGVADCKGNISGADNMVQIGIPQDAVAGDLIINEILFNPRPGSYDYAELYNKSNKLIDASKIFIANRNSNGAVSSAKPLSLSPLYIFPNDYIAITENKESLLVAYLVKNPEKLFVIPSLPSLPNDAGDIVITNAQGDVLDEVKYDAAWHFKLIDNPEGVSLERTDPGGPSQEASNWHSASSTAGYGTPTYKNSQFKQTQIADATIEISPKVFSPDNDGRDDIAAIQYKVSEPGYVANITIFDAAGRPVRVLVNNGTLALSGYWNWDGLNDKGIRLPIGTYIIFTEIFNLQGKKKRFKNAVVLARGLN